MKTRPQCRVLRVWGVPAPLLPPTHPRHEERDHMVVFFVSGVSLHCSLHPILPRREERDHVVAFFTSGVFPQHPLDPDTENATIWSRSLCLAYHCLTLDTKT